MALHQTSLLDGGLPPRPAPRGWSVPEIPNLIHEHELIIDFETTGLRWFAGDRPVGIGVGTLDGQSWYLPFGHAGGNLDEDKVKAWCRDTFAGKRIVAFKTTFDAHMAREWGCDLEELGCEVTDVAHWAALLDDSRRQLNLDSISLQYLNAQKVKGLDTSRMRYYHAGEVEAYARQDINLTVGLRNKLWPMLTEQNLHTVRKLEDDVIFVTCEMEKNGCPIDVEKLKLWIVESQRDYVKACWDLIREAGFRVEPGKVEDVRKLFTKFKIPIPINNLPGARNEGKETFEDTFLAEIDHPAIRMLRRARKLHSLRSKYFLRYMEEYEKFGFLRYSLNQLRSDDGGTISGRFSSSRFSNPDGTNDGINVQQVSGKKHMSAMKKADPVLAKYKVRELFVPASGSFLSADAKQIEYRLFAHYAQPPHVIKAYQEDPNTDFHNIVMEMVQRVRPDITRERTKDLNFAKIYGAGLKKIAAMLRITIEEAQPFVDAYNQAFPQAGKLLHFASKTAESRGYVMTLLGRRARFPQAYKIYSALNRIIQGGAGDINKQKLVDLHREQKYTNMKLRFTVHDEAAGDVPDLAAAKRVAEVLDRQSIKTSVPILWDVKIGPSWGSTKGIEEVAA